MGDRVLYVGQRVFLSGDSAEKRELQRHWQRALEENMKERQRLQAKAQEERSSDRAFEHLLLAAMLIGTGWFAFPDWARQITGVLVLGWSIIRKLERTPES